MGEAFGSFRPTLVAFTSRSAARTACAKAGPSKGTASAPNASARAAARAKVRFATRTRAPACTRAYTTARAAPPAPSTTAHIPRAVTPAASRARANPGASVLCPMRRPASFTIVFTAPIAWASGLTASRYGMTATLWGTVTFTPRYARRTSITRDSSSPGGVSKRR